MFDIYCCTELQHRTCPPGNKLSAVTLGHKRPIISSMCMCTRAKSLNPQLQSTLLLLLLMQFAKFEHMFNRTLLSPGCALNEEQKVKGAAPHRWLKQNIHWDCLVITIQVWQEQRKHCYEMKHCLWEFYPTWQHHMSLFLSLTGYFLFIISVLHIKKKNYWLSFAHFQLCFLWCCGVILTLCGLNILYLPENRLVPWEFRQALQIRVWPLTRGHI